MRLVLDTNVLVSALISSKGAPAVLLDSWIEGRFVLVTSPEQIDELRRVLDYGRIRSRLAPEQAEVFVRTLEKLAECVQAITTIDLSPDPDDNLILGTAVAGKADLLVSGDKDDLLTLERVGDTRIVGARHAVDILQQAGAS